MGRGKTRPTQTAGPVDRGIPQRSPRERPEWWTEVHRAALGRGPPVSDPVHVNSTHGGREAVGARMAPTWLPRRPTGEDEGEGTEIDGGDGGEARGGAA